MQQVILPSMMIIFLASCGAEESKIILPQIDKPEQQPSDSADSQPKPNDPIANKQEAQFPLPNQEEKEKSELYLRSLQWLSWAPLCDGYPSKENCDDGDVTLFSGLLCASGIDLGCEGVRAAQDSAGRFWRSPRRVGETKENSFSRDMALGVLHYLITSEDSSAALSWLEWIDQNSVCQINGPNECILRLYRFCSNDTDARCAITPGMWSLMRRVWEVLDLPLHEEMLRWSSFGESLLLSEAQNARLGYELHLKAVIAYLYQRMNLNLSFETELKRTLFERQQQNPFFRYLYEGVSQELIASVLDMCPKTQPSRRFQWAWERDIQEQAWLESMGWDCLFMGQVLDPQ